MDTVEKSGKSRPIVLLVVCSAGVFSALRAFCSVASPACRSRSRLRLCRVVVRSQSCRRQCRQVVQSRSRAAVHISSITARLSVCVSGIGFFMAADIKQRIEQ